MSCVYFSITDEIGAQAGDLAAIAAYTGGLILQPLSEEDLLKTFEAEALMQVIPQSFFLQAQKLSGGGRRGGGRGVGVPHPQP